jgi:hypothetical protein
MDTVPKLDTITQLLLAKVELLLAQNNILMRDLSSIKQDMRRLNEQYRILETLIDDNFKTQKTTGV